MNHVGEIEPDSDEYRKSEWLLFPGRWGVEESTLNTQGVASEIVGGTTPPRGPIFLKSFSDGDLGERWLNPWRWAEEFPVFQQGSNDWSANEQIVYLGNTEESNILETDESRSILRGGLKNDIYRIPSNLLTDASGSFIQDLGGDFDELDLSELNIQTAKRDGTALILDLDNDGDITYSDDLTILDFFKDESSEEGGVGFIENLDDRGLW